METIYVLHSNIKTETISLSYPGAAPGLYRKFVKLGSEGQGVAGIKPNFGLFRFKPKIGVGSFCKLVQGLFWRVPEDMHFDFARFIRELT